MPSSQMLPGAASPVYGFMPGAINVGGGPLQTSGSAAPVVSQGDYTGPLAQTSFLGQPFAFYLGMFLLLFLFKFLNEHDKSPIGREVSGIHIGAGNVLTITVAAMVGIATAKLIFTRFQVPGLSQFVNYV